MMKYDYLLENCKLCKRECSINRLKGELGFCAATDKIKIAKASLHFWEEPPISGSNGSGTIFFSHCNFKCVFCQNYDISQEYNGANISIERLSEIFLELEQKGANNINLVTPTSYVPQIIAALDIARNNGLTLPILYNTNGFDTLDTIKLLDGYIDVYLPDYKYFDDKYAIKYSKVSGYKDNLLPILKEMFRQTGNALFDENGRITKGVIIRHLLLPGLLFDSKKIIDSIYNTFGDNVYISIMNQYTPMFNASNYPEINKSVNPKLYNALIDYASELGVKNGFIQESSSSTEYFIPKFNLDGVFKN